MHLEMEISVSMCECMLKIKIYKTIILLVFCMSVKLGLSL